MNFEIAEVNEVPRRTREGKGSKYEAIFDAVREADTGLIRVEFEDRKEAATRATYLRRLDEDDEFIITQRENAVYVMTAEAAAALD